MKHLSLKDALLPQPPSFVKKQLYEVHEVLGTGTFGKVMVSCAMNATHACRSCWLGHGRWVLAPGCFYRALIIDFFLFV